MSIKTKILISYSVVFATLIFMVLYSFMPSETSSVATCGTEFIDSTLENPKTKEGKKLFKALCASCHKVSKKLIGPALGNLQMPPDIFGAFIRTEDSLVRQQHPLALQINAGTNTFNYKHQFKDLTQQNIKNLLDFLKD